jgi:hypothetical protein
MRSAINTEKEGGMEIASIYGLACRFVWYSDWSVTGEGGLVMAKIDVGHGQKAWRAVLVALLELWQLSEYQSLRGD